MSLSEQVRLEISELASAAIDGGITAQGMHRLEELLRDSAEARDYYVRLMGVSAELAWAARGATEATEATAATELIVLPARRSWQRQWFPVSAAAAILLLAFLGISVLLQKPATAPPAKIEPEGVALLSTAVNLEWEGSQEPLHVGNVLKPGWMRLKSGLTQIEFFSGTSVWLEGPAALRLDTVKDAYCESGKLVAEVPHGSRGFRVQTPLGTVVDHGTGFGIEVKDAQVTVHIFEGVVEVTPNGHAAREYVSGEAVVLQADGTARPGVMDARVFDYLGYGWNFDGYGQQDWDPPRHAHGPGGVGMPGWKGGDPMDFIRGQIGASAERWAVLSPKLAAYLLAQREFRGDGFPDNVVARAEWDLWLATTNPESTDEELGKRLESLRYVRLEARGKYDAAGKSLSDVLTVSEEARLVALGFMR